MFVSSLKVRLQGMLQVKRFWVWSIWFISNLFVLFQFFLQMTSGVIIEGLMKSFSLTPFGGSLLASSYYYIYVILQVPAGFLVDQYGIRRLLFVTSAICAVGCLFFSTAGSLSVAWVGRLLMGGGGAFAFVGAMRLLSNWFPIERFGFMAAVTETAGMLGSLLGAFFLAHWVEQTGWRHAMITAGLLGLVISLLLVLIIRDRPVTTGSEAIVIKSRSSLFADMNSLIKNPVVWFNGIYSSAIFSIITVFVALWGIPFLQKVYHLTLVTSTVLCNMVFVGVAIGAPLVGYLDARIRARHLLMASCAGLSMCILVILIYIPVLSISMIGTLMFLLGMSSSTYVISFVIAHELATERTRGISIGFTNMFSVASALIFQPLIGLVLYLVSAPGVQTNFTVYSARHFQLALLIIPLLILVAFLLGFYLPNRDTVKREEES